MVYYVHFLHNKITLQMDKNAVLEHFITQITDYITLLNSEYSNLRPLIKKAVILRKGIRECFVFDKITDSYYFEEAVDDLPEFSKTENQRCCVKVKDVKNGKLITVGIEHGDYFHVPDKPVCIINESPFHSLDNKNIRQ